MPSASAVTAAKVKAGCLRSPRMAKPASLTNDSIMGMLLRSRIASLGVALPLSPVLFAVTQFALDVHLRPAVVQHAIDEAPARRIRIPFEHRLVGPADDILGPRLRHASGRPAIVPVAAASATAAHPCGRQAIVPTFVGQVPHARAEPAGAPAERHVLVHLDFDVAEGL